VIEQDTDDREGTDAVEARKIAHLLGTGAAIELPWHLAAHGRFGHGIMLGDVTVIS
jgi:hypothetical protein